MAKEFFNEGGDFPPSHAMGPAPVDSRDPVALHRGLAHFNKLRVAVATPGSDWREHLRAELAWRSVEGEFLESLRAAVAPSAVWAVAGTANNSIKASNRRCIMRLPSGAQARWHGSS